MRLTLEQRYRSLALDATAELNALLEHPERKGESWRPCAKALLIVRDALEEEFHAR